MKKGSTLFLRGAVVLIGLIVLALCIFALPAWLRAEDDIQYKAFIWGMYVAAVPFFGALYQALKLLSFIDKNKAFSDMAVKALRNVTLCAVAISLVFAAELPVVFSAAQMEDAPGLILIFSLIFIFIPFVIATFAAVLQQLLKSAIEYKAENELTV